MAEVQTVAAPAVGAWFADRIVDTGRLPLFCFFVGMVLGFLFIRASVRMIRANVRWWPGNLTSGDMHIHHMAFGVGFMVVGGVAGLAIPDDLVGWSAGAAAVFGVGTALVLDEFALILYLRDVYWEEQGRISVDALFAVVAVTGLLLLGLHPLLINDAVLIGAGDQSVHGAWAVVPLVVTVGLAAVTVLKGKAWTGLAGMFLLVPLLIGAVRLGRPNSPWARWRYHSDDPRGVRKRARAHRREQRLRHPVSRAKNRFQDLVAGRPHR